MATIHDSAGRGIGEDNPLAVRQIQSDVILPIDIQSRYAQTIQTHNAVSVPASGSSSSTLWIDCDGFTNVAFTLYNDAGTNSTVQLSWSHDGSTQHGTDTPIIDTNRWKTGETGVKARYMRVFIANNDATLAHTMSSWVYLKA
jgi:hypothetical protein